MGAHGAQRERDSMVAGITSSHVNGGFNRDVFNDPEAQVSAAGDIEA